MFGRRLILIGFLLALLGGIGLSGCAGGDSDLFDPAGDDKPASQEGPLGAHGTSDD
jgi:hypothetical protein